MTRAFIPSLFGDSERIVFRPFLEDLKNWPAECSCKQEVGMYEDEEAIIVEAPLPGLKADEIKVDLKEGVLYIQGEKKEEKKEGKTHRKWSSKYSYSILLPQPVDESASIEAQTKDGVLTIRLPKSKAAKPVKITVKGS